MQEQLLAAAAAATGRFTIPDALAREMVANAYLGMLDVNPWVATKSAPNCSQLSIQFWGEGQADGRIFIRGSSLVHAKNREGVPGMPVASGTIASSWIGAASPTSTGRRIREIILTARGHEKLQMGWPRQSR